MSYVKKFFVCAFLGLVIFTQTCFAAMTCDEQVNFSATFKWNDGRVSMKTTNIDRQIADDTEVYNAARARIDVLAGAFTKPLSQGRRFDACNESETCEAGQTLQECSPALTRCFAEIIAKDEYIANLQNRLCNSGINLNRQNDQFRDLLASYTPLRVPTSSNSSSSGEPQVTGSGEAASVADVNALNRFHELLTTIIDQTNSMELGMSFVYYVSDERNIQKDMSDWDSACKKVKKPERAKTTGSTDVVKGKTKQHICVIKTCRGRGYEPSADGLSCVLAESDDATAPASSSGGGSTKTPAPTTPVRSNTPRGDLEEDDKQMINNQISKSAGRGNMSRDGSDVSGGRSIGAIITEINTASKNMRIGTAAFSYPESMVSTGGEQLKTAIDNWITRCTEYPKTHDSSAINKTKPEKTTENGTISHTCIIESCNEFYTQSSDGSTCERAQSQPIESGKSCIPSDKHAEFGQFNEEKNICEVRTCKEDYTLTPDGKCEKTKKLERQAAKATTRLEKDFVSDINKLSDAFDKVVKKLTKECEKSGGTIKNGVCENAQTTEPATDPKTQASTNRRGSGRK